MAPCGSSSSLNPPKGVIIEKNLKGKELLEVLMKTFGK